MALDSYNALKDSVADFLNRDDLDDVIPDLITLAEKQIDRRLRRGTVRAGFVINAQVQALPSDCAELRSIRYDVSLSRHAIPIVTPEALSDFRTESQGLPRYAAVVDGVLLFDRVPDQSYDAEIIYFSRLVPLSSGNASNDILVSAPDLYLFGALKEAEPYLDNDGRVPLWTAKFEEALLAEEIARERAELGASLRPMRLPVVF